MSSKLLSHKDRVDALISQMWKSGYLTISRKYGKYLPSPKPIGDFEVDVIARYKKNYMMGIVVNEKELKNPKFLAKIIYLSSRNVKYSKEKVKLLIGVNIQYYNELKNLIDTLPSENKEQIQIYPINN